MHKYLFIFLSILIMTTKSKLIQKNVYNQELQICSTDPITGYYRNGYCVTDD